MQGTREFEIPIPENYRDVSIEDLGRNIRPIILEATGRDITPPR